MRAQLYQLAARLFDDPLREDDDLRPLMARVIYRSPIEARWIPPLLEIAEDHASKSLLAAESARLFVESGVPPFSSFWLQREMARAPGAGDIVALLHRYGIDEAWQAPRRPDHLVCELALMSRLADDDDPVARSAEMRFFQHQLSIWVPRFTAALRAARPARRYTMASLYLDRLIAWDRTRVEASPQRTAAAHA